MVQWVKDLALSPQWLQLLLRCILNPQQWIQDLVLAQVNAAAQIQSLAWELPYTEGLAKERKEKKERKREGGREEEGNQSCVPGTRGQR